jgi:hypothetical protein
MQRNEMLSRVAGWGYVLLPRPHDTSPGFGGLLVAIRDTPTEEHYDPEHVTLPLGSGRKGASRVTLGRTPAGILPENCLCAGRIDLLDRYHKKVQFFGFGGKVIFCREATETVYAIETPAPLLAIRPPSLNSVPELLALAAEAALARAHAVWGADSEGFACCVAAQDPLRFYAALICALLQRHERHPDVRRVQQELHGTLLAEREWLQAIGAWSPTTLTDLLAPAEDRSQQK